LLTESGIKFRFREYTEEPLSADELRSVLSMLGVPAVQVLRKNDRAYKELGLDGTEDEAALVSHMAEHPTLLQRPIGVLNGRAIVGRPAERLLELL
jgi:arsenate reductase